MAENYKSIFIPNKVVFIADPSGAAFVADCENADTIKKGRYWAMRSAKAGYVPKEYTYDNGNFILKIQNAAANSWNGGKLSFWTCVIKCPDSKEFRLGINSESLCELICNNTFINGECEEKVLFGTRHGQYGMYTKNMPSYQDYLNAAKLRDNMKTSQTVSYKPGDVVRTLTDSSTYIGTIYKYFDIEKCGWQNGYYKYKITHYCTPKTMHVFANKDRNDWDIYSLKFLNKKPKRMLTGQTEDISNMLTNWLQKEASQLNSIRDDGFQNYAIESYVLDLQFGLEASAEDIEEKVKDRIKSLMLSAYDSQVWKNYVKKYDIEFIQAE